MKKMTRLLASVVCVASLGATCLVGCGDKDKVSHIDDTQVAEMNQAVSITKDYAGSYTINEVQTSEQHQDGIGKTYDFSCTADVGYNSDTKAFCYWADLTEVPNIGKTVMIYAKENTDGTAMQYQKAGVSKQAKKLPNIAAVKTDGFKSTNGAGETVALYYDSLAEAINTFYMVDLAEASAITTAAEYSEFWMNSYQKLVNGLVAQYGMTASYEDGGSEVSTEGTATVYTFTFTGDGNGTGSWGGLEVSDLELTVDVSVFVEEGKLIKIECDIVQEMDIAGIDIKAINNIVDAFTYSYNMADHIPTDEELATYSVQDLTQAE